MTSHLLPSEQFKEWIERNVSVRIRGQQLKFRNKAAKTEDSEAYLRSHFCSRPFEAMETTPSGLVYMCCPAWLPTPIGTLDHGLDELWRNTTAAEIRGSIVDGSFRHCSRLACAAITGRSLMPRESEEAQAIIAAFDPGVEQLPAPKEIILSHDRSCNLSCPSCRKETIVVGKAKQQRLDDMVDDKLLPALREADRVYITGSGDPFGSAHFRRLIKRLTRADFPNLLFHLHTNAQLWDKRAWDDLDLAGRVETAHISIDAAEPEAYSILRRGGTFERLLKNLAFVKALRESGELTHLTISMVVQQLNFRQMPAFVRLGKAHAVDEISFQMIRNWGTYSAAEFKDQYVGRSHPDFPELLRVLEAPELRLPGVDIGNIDTHTNLALAA